MHLKHTTFGRTETALYNMSIVFAIVENNALICITKLCTRSQFGTYRLCTNTLLYVLPP